MSGMHYVCTPNLTLYSQAGFSKDAYLAQVATNVQLKAAGEPHPNIWLPDSNNQDYYLIDMPGTLARPQHTHTHMRTRVPLTLLQATTSTTPRLARACAPTRTTTTCTRGATASRRRGRPWP